MCRAVIFQVQFYTTKLLLSLFQFMATLCPNSSTVAEDISLTQDYSLLAPGQCVGIEK